VNVFSPAPQTQAFPAHGFVVASEKEMQVASEVSQLAAVKEPNSPRSDNRDAEVWKQMAKAHGLEIRISNLEIRNKSKARIFQ
jgi:hypothetical protein